MSDNALTIFGGNKIGFKDKQTAAAALKGSAALDPRGLPDGSEYLNFSGKRGVYTIGKDQEDVDPEEWWIVNVYGFQDGYVCWKAGRPAARRMASIYDTPIPAPDPDEHGPFSDSKDGWFQAKSMVLKSVDSGVQAQFSTNSKSGVSVFSGLIDLVADRMQNGHPEWPIVKLDKEKFTAQGNVNYKPKFHIVGWLGDAEVAELGAVDEISRPFVKKLLKKVDGSASKLQSGDEDEDEDSEDAKPLRRRTISR